MPNDKNQERLVISNQIFMHESSLAQYVEWEALSLTNFSDCTFEDIDFLGRVVNFCKFENSEFKNSSFRKCQFAKCTFQNCQLVDVDLTRGEFRNCNFINCQFIESNLAASDFFGCEFFQVKFANSNLNLIGAQSVKVSNLKQSIEIEESSNLEKILKDMNLIISTDPDQIQNP